MVIWTTTPWTMPGNRAIAYGPDIDYARLEVGSVAEGARARAGERLVVAEACSLPRFCEATGITGHHVVHALQGRAIWTAPSAPIRSRGRGYDFPVPLLPADHVTTEAGTGFVHTAPGHGEDDFEFGRAHGLEVPDTVGDDGAFNAWVPLFAGGCMSTRRPTPVSAALPSGGRRCWRAASWSIPIRIPGAPRRR